MTNRKPKSPRSQADLRARQIALRLLVAQLKDDVRIAEAKLAKVDAQLGTVRDRHPAGSGAEGGAP